MSDRKYRGTAGAALAAAMLLFGIPASAQETGTPPQAPEIASDTIFDGDWITLGIGAGLSPSYDGSDDYVLSPLPFLQGSLLGVDITPRPAGVALDFVADGDGPVAFDLGIAAKLNRNRADQIEDPVVLAYGELETAIEVGPTVGIVFPRLLNPFDSLTIGTDVLWDVNGAHGGMLVNPSVNYFTPVSRGAAVGLALSARYVDDAFADYYYSVPVAPAALAAGDRLPVFDAEGGFDKLGANLLLALDFDGDVTNGGFAAFAIGGYSKMIGDAADSPFTRIRGATDQWFLGAGLGYTF
jgi:MipA family protein